MKKYKCMNIGNCDNANTGKPFEIAEGEKLECPVCHKDMIVEVKGPNFKLIGIIIGALAVLGIGGGAAWALLGGKAKPEKITLDKQTIELTVGESASLQATVTPAEAAAGAILLWDCDGNAVTVSGGQVKALQEGTATVTVKVEGAEGVSALCLVNVKPVPQPEPEEKEGEEKKIEASISVSVKKTGKGGNSDGGTAGTSTVGGGTVNLGYGIYEGPTKGGKANGIGGTIRFTRTYSIDLKKATGETVEVNAGDRMINVKMENNRIIQGQLKRADGSQKWIIIG